MTNDQEDDYGISKIQESQSMAAPQLDYLPSRPTDYQPNIGLIGAGGITEYHLKAYRRMNLAVTAICDINIEQAEKRRDEFYPAARVTNDYQDIMKDASIDVVDVATHPEVRVEIIKAAIAAGKHILSQKPFVTDLRIGQELVDLAESANVKLAVNQNGRWAPHFGYLTKAVQAGVIGDLASIDFVLHWDHTWTAGTPFEDIHHLLLYDFAVHWFDITSAMVGNQQPVALMAAVRKTSFQTVKPPFLGHVIIDYPNIQVRMCFNAHVVHGQQDQTTVAGSKGTLRAFGPGLNEQKVKLWTAAGHAAPQLEGNWFDNGFEGTMGELLCAIEEDRQPWNSARDNLRSLELCFAAKKSADSGEPAHWR